MKGRVNTNDNDGVELPDATDDRTKQLVANACNAKGWDAIFAQEMNKLSVQERERVYEEIHGVDSSQPENEKFLNDKLQQFDLELSKIDDKPAYDMAMKLNPYYVRDTTFRLSFIRAEEYDIKAAAKRMVSFMENKLKYFGPSVLSRPIYLSDLDDDDMEVVNSGYLQYMPTRDKAGRAIWCDVHSMFPKCYKTVRNMLRAFIYLMTCIAEDEETQRKGVVSIMYQVSGTATPTDRDPQLFREAPGCIRWLPIRVTSAHMCTDSTSMIILLRILLASAGKRMRLRHRLHYGSHAEVQYSMMTFGVPVEMFPLTSQGELKTGNHMKWLASRKAKEAVLQGLSQVLPIHFNATMQNLRTPHPKSQALGQQYTQKQQALPISSSPYSTSFSKINLPHRCDVLLGRGKPLFQHAGNLFMRELVLQRIDEYKNAPRGSKMDVVQDVFNIIRFETGGRFLRKDSDNWWIEVPDDKAVETIQKSFKSSLSTVPTKRPVTTTATTNPSMKGSPSVYATTTSHVRHVKNPLETGEGVLNLRDESRPSLFCYSECSN